MEFVGSSFHKKRMNVERFIVLSNVFIIVCVLCVLRGVCSALWSVLSCRLCSVLE